MSTIYEIDDPSRMGVHTSNLPRYLREFLGRTDEYYILRPIGCVMFTGIREMQKLPTLQDICMSAKEEIMPLIFCNCQDQDCLPDQKNYEGKNILICTTCGGQINVEKEK